MSGFIFSSEDRSADSLFSWSEEETGISSESLASSLSELLLVSEVAELLSLLVVSTLCVISYSVADVSAVLSSFDEHPANTAPQIPIARKREIFFLFIITWPPYSVTLRIPLPFFEVNPKDLFAKKQKNY